MLPKRKITPLILLLVGLLMFPAHDSARSQDEVPQIKYGFWFWDQTPNSNIGVAVLDSNNEWTVSHIAAGEDLRWSPDGQALYGVEQEVVPYDTNTGIFGRTSFGRIVAVYEYPDWRLTRRIKVLPDSILEDRTQAEILRIQSISPDGHYMWLVGTRLSNRPVLIDLKTGAVIAQPECPGEVLGWIGNRAVVHGTFGLTAENWQPCPPALYTLDGATGVVVTLAFGATSFPIDPRFYLTEMIYLPRWDAVVVGSEGPPATAMLKLDGTAGFLLDYAFRASVSPDQRYLVYLLDELIQGRLVRLDLETAIPEPLDVGSIENIHWEGNTLVYETLQGDRYGQWQIYEHRVYPGGQRSSLLIRYGTQTGHLSRDPEFRLYKHDDKLIAAVVQYGREIWSSADLFPHPPFNITSVSEPTHNHRYVWLLEADDYLYGAYRMRYLFDMQNLEIIHAPDGWQISAIAPDGEWVLCSPIEDGESHQYGLMAYHPASGKAAMLSETAHINRGNGDPQALQFYFHWSSFP